MTKSPVCGGRNFPVVLSVISPPGQVTIFPVVMGCVPTMGVTVGVAPDLDVVAAVIFTFAAKFAQLSVLLSKKALAATQPYEHKNDPSAHLPATGAVVVIDLVTTG